MAALKTAEAGQIRAAVERITASRHFAQAESLSNLLKYIVERSLDGNSQFLKEYTLGVDVFHRGADFNPKEDTIVRVQARALRSRLEAYYQAEGKREPIRVVVPKGTYAPAFETASRQRSVVSGSNRVRVWLAAAITFTAVGLAWTWSTSHRLFQPAPCSTLAVLPFDIVSAPGRGFIGPALAQELAMRLSEVSGLTIISFESASRHKRSGKPLIELNAACAVEGRVRSDADEIELDLILKNGQSGRTIWRQVYRRPLEEILKLEADVTEALARRALSKSLPPAPKNLWASTVNPEAALLYLEARQEFNRYDEAGFKRSIDLYEQAIGRQPDYALAYAGMALSWFRRSNFFVPPNEGMPKARAAARHALELAPELAEAHAVLAAVSLTYDWRPAAAYAELQRAMAIAPSQPLVHEMTALYYISVGRFNEAFTNLRIARERDPRGCPILVERATLAGAVSGSGKCLFYGESQMKKRYQISISNVPSRSLR